MLYPNLLSSSINRREPNTSSISTPNPYGIGRIADLGRAALTID